jgi:hypothetical protein
MSRRDEWTTAPWRKLEGRRPGTAGDRGRMAADPRPCVHGVLGVRRSGAHGHHRPARSGHWQRRHTRGPRWANAGGWERRWAMRMQAPTTPALLLDATMVRAPQPAAVGTGGLKTRRGGVPVEDCRRTSPWQRLPKAARCA